MARASRDYDRFGGIDREVRIDTYFESEPGGDPTGECTPPMDVLETAEAVEILMDIPGVEPDGIRVHVVQGTVIVAGRKRLPACAHGHATFHLAERTCGRFARAVRLTGALDVGRATATLAGGELRVILPCIEERRGHDIRIEITVG